MKKLIHEIHRRSLWQVLGIYVLGSWLVLQVVNELADALNLPEWAASFAVFLLIVGLPVVMATAFVQEGVHREDEEDFEPDTTSDGTLAERPASGERPPAGERKRSGLFKWRNAVFGGVFAFALWGVAAAVWLLAVGPPTFDPGFATETANGNLPIESIAVLAFEDMSPDGDQAHFADGISEEILNVLAGVPGLKVPARSSSFQYRGKSPDVREVGRDLGVQTVLEGSVRKSQGSLRITVQLIDAEDGFHIWSETYDRRDEDVFEVQQDIARSVLTALNLDVEDDDLPSIEAPAGGIEAHELYLLGLSRFHARAKLEDVEAAHSWFERAVAADSSYARAHAAVALVYSVLPQWSDMPRDLAAPRAREAAGRASALDSTLAEPYMAMCQSLTYNEWAWEEAGVACKRSIELNPNSELAQQWYAEYLIFAGRFEEAHDGFLRARELSPLSGAQITHIHGRLHVAMAEPDSAIAIELPAWSADPDDVFARRNLLMALFQRAQREDEELLTRAMVRMATTREDSLHHAEFVTAFLAADADPEMRAHALSLVPDLNLPGGAVAALPAQLYVWLGDEDAAIAELQRKLEIHDTFLPNLLRQPEMTELYDDPRFGAVWRGVFGDMPMETP